MGVSLTDGFIAAQTIELVSQDGPFQHTSGQPDTDIRMLELYFGGLYDFASSGSYQPYIGAGLSLVTGKAHKTFTNLKMCSKGQESMANLVAPI